MAKPKRAADDCRAANVEAACIIAADPAKHPGLMQEWARLVIERSEMPPADAEDKEGRQSGNLCANRSQGPMLISRLP
jgi:hypothetical protein